MSNVIIHLHADRSEIYKQCKIAGLSDNQLVQLEQFIFTLPEVALTLDVDDVGNCKVIGMV